MSGIADLHMLTALQNGYKQITAGKDDADPYAGLGYGNFERMFPGIADDMKKEWWTGMVAKTVHFRANAAPGHDDFPVVVVHLLSEINESEPMGLFVGKLPAIGHSDLHAVIVRQTVLCTVMSNNAEVTRALFVVIRAIMLFYHRMFLQVGYLECSYAGAEELSPEEELVAEDMGVFVRKQRYEVVSQVNAYPLDSPVSDSFPWFVHTEDIVTSSANDPDDSTKRVPDDDGTPGGVVQQT